MRYNKAGGIKTQQHSELTMGDQDKNPEQRDAADMPNPKKEIHIRIDLGKRFCIFVVVLAALVAGVFVVARFIPRGFLFFGGTMRGLFDVRLVFQIVSRDVFGNIGLTEFRPVHFVLIAVRHVGLLVPAD